MKKIVFVGIAIISIIAFLIIGYYFWPINVENINNCNSDSDCIIVKAGYCGSGRAINRNYIDTWNRHLEAESIRLRGVACKPTLPLDSFEGKCIEGKCVAEVKQEALE